MPPGQPKVDNSSLRQFSKVILGCIKGILKANQHNVGVSTAKGNEGMLAGGKTDRQTYSQEQMEG